MREEWKIKGKLLQELNALRIRIEQLDKAEHSGKNVELKESDEFSALILDNFIEGVLLIDVEKHKLVIGNKAICKMLSCKREKITNLRIKDILPQETSIHIIEQAEKKMSKMASSAYNVPVKKNDGSILFADITSVPLTFANKKYIITIFRETFSNEIKSTRHQNASADSCEYPHLTATEINVLKLIVNGMGNKEIARLLSRSQKTIENHRAHLMKKLDVHNSVELIRRAIAIGLVNMKVELQQENVT